MDTKIFRIKGTEDENIKVIGDILRNGGVVGIPTETVYGLAANALDGQAVLKIFKAKGRPADNPLIVHIAELDDMKPLVKEIPKEAYKLSEKFWPGPLTMILPKSDIIPDEVSAGLDTVAIRMPSHKIANAIIKAAGVPLAAPSANLSGSPSPTTAKHVVDDMNGKIDAIADGGDCEVGVESTVITLATEVPRLLRPGGISKEQLESVLGKIDVDEAVMSKIDENKKVSSPGMKYKHYSPKAKVVIIESDADKFADYVNTHNEKGTFALCFKDDKIDTKAEKIFYGTKDDSLSQAHDLFDALRKADEMGAKILYARSPKKDGVGLAVYNRLLRAAAFEVIEL